VTDIDRLIDTAAALALEAADIHRQLPGAMSASGSIRAAAELSGRQQSALAVAGVLASVAEAALAAKAFDAGTLDGGNPLAGLGDDEDAEDAVDGGEKRPANPHPLQARFRAELVGEQIVRFPGRSLLFIPPEGWIDVTGAPKVADDDGFEFYLLTGRAMSVYNGTVLCHVDQTGAVAVLPETLITLEADE